MQRQQINCLSIFEGLTDEQMGRVLPVLWPIAFDAGDVVFDQGDPAEVAYVTLAGQVALRFHPCDGDWLTIATVYPGEVFGWSAVLGRPYYTSAAVCLSPVDAIAVYGAELRALTQGDPELGSALLGRMALSTFGRQDHARQQIAELIRAEAALANA